MSACAAREPEPKKIDSQHLRLNGVRKECGRERERGVRREVGRERERESEKREREKSEGSERGRRGAFKGFRPTTVVLYLVLCL